MRKKTGGWEVESAEREKTKKGAQRRRKKRGGAKGEREKTSREEERIGDRSDMSVAS